MGSLIKNKHGRIVSKAASVRAKKTMSPAFKAFADATKKARKELGIKVSAPSAARPRKARRCTPRSSPSWASECISARGLNFLGNWPLGAGAKATLAKHVSGFVVWGCLSALG